MKAAAVNRFRAASAVPPAVVDDGASLVAVAIGTRRERVPPVVE
jgi:hypothetical protein